MIAYKWNADSTSDNKRSASTIYIYMYNNLSAIF